MVVRKKVWVAKITIGKLVPTKISKMSRMSHVYCRLEILKNVIYQRPDVPNILSRWYISRLHISKYINCCGKKPIWAQK
jgi:hypothetical protein